MTTRDERDEGLGPCTDCGQDIGLEASGSYEGTEGVALCWACALRRGGVYDADRDRWLVTPEVGDLGDERQPHA